MKEPTEVLNWIAIENYKCFRTTDKIQFSPSWNVVVGKNNSGKSSLFKALRLTELQNLPYRGLGHDPTQPIDPKSRVKASVTIRGPNILRLLSNDFEFCIPMVSERNTSIPSEQVLETLLNEGHLTVDVEVAAGAFWQIGNARDHQGQQIFPANSYEAFKYDTREKRFRRTKVPSQPGIQLANQISATFQSNSYNFDAERLHIGVSNIGTSTILSPNASNLAEVLLKLREHARLFNDYNRLVNEVFPEIQAVIPTVVGPSSVEVRISTATRSEDRTDLHINLRECGTGVSQVLAILYVAVSAETPHLIVIDEPNSFLHPGAAKQLIRILKRFAHHQFIISTHSPELINTVSPDALFLVRWMSTGSVVTRVGEGVTGLKDTLRELGTQFSDVFGLDGVIFVEGDTEVACYQIILEHENRGLKKGIDFVKIGDPDKLTGRDAALYIRSYEKMFSTVGVIPPLVAFCRDRETLSDKDVSDLERELRGKLRLLPRRCLENYLIHPEALSKLFEQNGEKIAADRIQEWLRTNGSHANYWRGVSPIPDVFSDQWYARVDAARLLDRLFGELTESRLAYRKVNHGAFLTRWLLDNSKQWLAELIEFVVRLSDIESPA